MRWNWQQPGWPLFHYDALALVRHEQDFLRLAGETVGAFRHFGQQDKDNLKIELLSEEAVKTSRIEGEILDRDSVQSSLRQQFGLGGSDQRVRQAERGISELMVDLYTNFAKPASHATLHGWHAMIMAGQRGIQTIENYRIHSDPMQVVSGAIHDPKIHFEAPPSDRMPAEMDRFLDWFNQTAPNGRQPLSALTRAGIAHLYFVCIHPFEDGNGRIGRAVAEKALAQNLGLPSLIALSFTIERARKDYYRALERNNRNLEVGDWLRYFAETAIEAQRNSMARVEFHLAKARFYDRFRGQMNPRQAKVVARLFQEGPDGFKGGLSAENYIRIARTSRASATRDLFDLVERGALTRTGQLRHTRYELAADPPNN